MDQFRTTDRRRHPKLRLDGFVRFPCLTEWKCSAHLPIWPLRWIRHYRRKVLLNRLQDVFKSFQKHDVKYVVIGGIASILHGVPRATFDLVILIEATPENAQRLLDALIDAGLGTATLTNVENILANEITIFVIGFAWTSKHPLPASTFRMPGETARRFPIRVKSSLSCQKMILYHPSAHPVVMWTSKTLDSWKSRNQKTQNNHLAEIKCPVHLC